MLKLIQSALRSTGITITLASQLTRTFALRATQDNVNSNNLKTLNLNYQPGVTSASGDIESDGSHTKQSEQLAPLSKEKVNPDSSNSTADNVSTKFYTSNSGNVITASGTVEPDCNDKRLR